MGVVHKEWPNDTIGPQIKLQLINARFRSEILGIHYQPKILSIFPFYSGSLLWIVLKFAMYNDNSFSIRGNSSNFSVLHHVQIHSGAQRASYLIGTAYFLSESKATWSWSWPLFPSSAEVRNHWAVLFTLTCGCLIKHWHFTFMYTLFIYAFFSMARQSLGGLGHLIVFRDFTITLLDTPHLVGLLSTRDQPVAETSTWQHTTLKKDRHPCPRRDSNPQSQ